MSRTLRLSAAEYAAIVSGRRTGGGTSPVQIIVQPERDVLDDCLRVLNDCPLVAFFWRQNVGGLKDRDDRFIKFAFKGCSDILGCSVRGRFIAVECKATGKFATPEQSAFLENVNRAGGFGICVDHAGKLALALRDL